jgi:hypothetical protein
MKKMRKMKKIKKIIKKFYKYYLSVRPNFFSAHPKFFSTGNLSNPIPKSIPVSKYKDLYFKYILSFHFLFKIKDFVRIIFISSKSTFCDMIE